MQQSPKLSDVGSNPTVHALNFNVPVVQLERILGNEPSDKGSNPFRDIKK